MKYLYSFLFCGVICLIAQIILDNTKLTAGHITSIFVSIGAVLEIGGIYDSIVKVVGGGALVPIVSFGHSLSHASLEGAKSIGLIGIASNMFSLTGAGIVGAIVLTFFFSMFFKPNK